VASTPSVSAANQHRDWERGELVRECVSKMGETRAKSLKGDGVGKGECEVELVEGDKEGEGETEVMVHAASEVGIMEGRTGLR
jgi:hypothetical protein